MKSGKQRGSVLQDAADTINGARQDQYGNPEDSFQLIADLWAAWLDKALTAHDVAVMMSLMKHARMAGAAKRDNYLDAAGYIALACDIAEEVPEHG